MDIIGNLAFGFGVAFSFQNLIFALIGALIGTAIGVLPGIGPVATISLLLPITFGQPATTAIIMLAGIYYGAQYGGSTTAILIRTPGEAASVMTSLDGYEMAKKGRAGAALAVSAIGSFIAGTIGVVALTLFAIPLASMALKFGPAEYFALAVLAFVAVSAVLGESRLLGFASLLFGLLLSRPGLLTAGIVLLLLTPVARVVVVTIDLLRRRDWVFAATSAWILGVLLFSLFVAWGLSPARQ